MAMPALAVLSLLALSPSLVSCGGDQYWWMDNQDVFSGSGGSHGGSNNRQQQQHQNYPQQQQQQQQQQSFNNDGFASNSVQTECPAGTKCVGEYFCDENAVMVNYRVELSPAQIRKRGELIPCMNQQTGNFDVCCSTAAPALPIDNNNNNNNQRRRPLPQRRQPSNNNIQQRQPANDFNNIPQGSCPAINSLPDISACDGMVSNCWSVGQADVDCPGNALCCFDGCRNTCYFGGGGQPAAQPAPQPRPPPPPPQRPQPPPPPPPQRPPPPPPQPPRRQPPPRQPATSSDTFPQSQGQGQFPQQPQQPSSFDQCPQIQPLGGNQCQNERDTCWNTGRQDDCQRGFLCCYDGCVKTCYDEARGEFLRHPQSQNNNQGGPAPRQPAPRQPAPAPVRPRPVSQPRPVTQPRRPRPSVQQPRPAPPQRQQSFRPQQQDGSYQKPVVQPRRPPQPAPRPAPQRPQRRRQQQQQPSFQGQQQPNRQQPGPPAETKPFVRCPSAMKCVERSFCDLEGVMSNTRLNLTPQLEMLSVPLIPCVNPDNQNVDVCCRDPNYKDPWPDMNGGGGNNNNRGFNSNQGFNNNNQRQGGGNRQSHGGGGGGGSRGGYGK